MRAASLAAAFSAVHTVLPPSLQPAPDNVTAVAALWLAGGAGAEAVSSSWAECLFTNDTDGDTPRVGSGAAANSSAGAVVATCAGLPVGPEAVNVTFSATVGGERAGLCWFGLGC